MERNLTPEEVAAQHLHECSACDLPAYHFCYCDTPKDARDCRDRIPGERRLNCPSLANHGKENLTELMTEQYARDASGVALRDGASKGVCDVRTRAKRAIQDEVSLNA
jgi:hypothetical protein